MLVKGWYGSVIVECYTCDCLCHEFDSQLWDVCIKPYTGFSLSN